MPGDFSAPARNRHDLVVEAVIEGTIVASYPNRTVERLAETDPSVGKALRDVTLAAASRSQRQILTLGRTTAAAKVGAFLLEMTERLDDGHSDQIVLPMSRYDIADYLALSVETVSRCLTALRRRGVIRLVGRRGVKINDRCALDEDDDRDWG